MIDYSFSLKELEYYLLILTRVTSFIFIAPFFGMNNTPKRVKIALGVFISYLLYQVITPHMYVEYNTTLGYAVFIMKEAATGLLIGFGGNICMMIMAFAGRMIDMDIGLSMASQYDPMTQDTTTISGQLYQQALLLMLVISGMYQFILKALVETFSLIPIGGATFRYDRIVTALIEFMSDYVIISFRIFLPVFASMLLLNAILGILAKVAPQLNMFSVGIQIKILMGTMVLFLTAWMLPGASDFIFTEMKKMMVAFVEAIM